MENFQPVTFYDDRNKWHHMKEVAQGRFLGLYAPDGNFPPFQFISKTDLNMVFSIYGATLEGPLSGDLIHSETITRKDIGNGYFAIIFPGKKVATEKGLYMYNLAYTSGPQTEIWSDPISVVEDRGFFKLEFWHHEDLEIGDWKFDMTASFKFRVYLKASSNIQDVIGKPIYVFEESVQRRAGYNFVISSLSSKRYVFETLVTEPIMDGLRIAKIMSNRQYTVNGVTKQIFDMAMNPVWEEPGYIAILTIELDPTDTVAMTVGKYRPEA